MSAERVRVADAEPEAAQGEEGEDLTLGLLLRLVRERGLNVTQEAWAATLGVSWRTVARWESEDVVPGTQVIYHLVEVLKRPELRARIHQREDVEHTLLLAGLIEPWAAA